MDNRVAGLVISHQLAFLWADDQRFPFLPVADLVAGSFKVGLGDMGLVLQGASNGGFVKQVRQISPRHARRGPGNDLQRPGRVEQRLAHGVSIQDGTASFPVWIGYVDLAVESPGTQQRFVQVVRAIGCPHDDDSLAALETDRASATTCQAVSATSSASASTALPINFSPLWLFTSNVITEGKTFW